MGYSAAEVSAYSDQLISGQRVKVTAPFDGFQIYMANWNAYHFTLSVYAWRDSYASTIAATPLKTISKTMTHGAVQPESLTWTDGALPAGEYLFVVENPADGSNAAARLGVAGVNSNVSKGEFYRLGTVVDDMELALDIRFTEAEPTGGYFADVYKPTYVSAYEGKPTYDGVGYSATEVSAHANQLISGRRVRVTAAFDGFSFLFSDPAYGLEGMGLAFVLMGINLLPVLAIGLVLIIISLVKIVKNKKYNKNLELIKNVQFK